MIRRTICITALSAGVAGMTAVSGDARPHPTRPPASPSFITADACIEHQAFFEGDSRAVAARLPHGYVAEVDPASGKPLLFARAERCRVNVGSYRVPATMASFGIVVHSPDGLGCASGAPAIGSLIGTAPPVCNWYPLVWLASDRRIVGWLRDGSPRFPALSSSALVLGENTAGTGSRSFHFAAAQPARVAFSMDDTGHPGAAPINVRGGYWAGPHGSTMKLAFSTNDITPGYASGVVRAGSGSLLAQLIGSQRADYLPAYGAIAAEHWSHGAYRKQLLTPAKREHRFAGSCSVNGTDTFDPPATNNAQNLQVSYDATGTCSGRLDGAAIQRAPVKWHSDAHSFGSCSQAGTVAPGTAAITFANGASIHATFDFSSVLTEIDMSFYGERSGYAPAHATFATARTTSSAITNCAGPGDRQVPMDLSLTTRSPLISTDRG